MATLNDDVKKFIVHALACYDTPSQVADAVREEFKLEVTRMQVGSYDPTKVMGRNLGEKWKVLFEETRKKFLDDQSSIPIASQNFRLRALNRMAVKAESSGNTVVAAQLIEQAAKEVGGQFTNRQKVDMSANVTMVPKSPQDYSDEELAAAIAAGGGAGTADQA